MEIFIHVDTIYINVKYPFSDVYTQWARYIEGIDHRTLSQGVVVDDYVIKTGTSGYKLSVWQGDARAYLTPDTDETRGVGNGMGIWLQLGPRFINAHGWELQAGVQKFLTNIGIIGNYPSTTTRIDIAIDLFDLDINTIQFEDMRLNWVGRSQLSSTHLDNTKITGYSIGSRSSAVYLRMYDKNLQAEKEGDLNYWQTIWERCPKSVTRFEWQVKPKEGNFSENLTDFHQLNQTAIQQLVDYLLDWGRLAEPNESDQVRSRWADSVLWQELRQAVKLWNPDDLDRLKRIPKIASEISPKYYRQLSGVLSGAMARCNPDNPNLPDVYEGLKQVVPFAVLDHEAKIKGQKIKNLTQHNIIEGENHD